MSDLHGPAGLVAAEAPLPRASIRFPEPFASRRAGLVRRALSEAFGMTGFAVFQTSIPPGGNSGLHHRHTRRGEFVYVLKGEATVVRDHDEVVLTAGMCIGYPPGGGHHLENRGAEELVYIDVTNLIEGDRIDFPNDDLVLATDAEGRQCFTHKDGAPYPPDR